MSSCESDERARKAGHTENAQPAYPTLPDTDVRQSRWEFVKTKVSSVKSKTSKGDRLWRRWSRNSNVGEEVTCEEPTTRWPDDEENSQFCESLLGLMECCGRFNYLEFSKSKNENEDKNETSQQQVQ